MWYLIESETDNEDFFSVFVENLPKNRNDLWGLFSL